MAGPEQSDEANRRVTTSPGLQPEARVKRCREPASKRRQLPSLTRNVSCRTSLPTEQRASLNSVLTTY